MKRMMYLLLTLCLLLTPCLQLTLLLGALVALTPLPARAAAAEPYVPPELEPWVDWVLHKHPNLACPRRADSGDLADCAWTTSLNLDVGQHAAFRMDVRVFARSRIELPGDAQHRPINVKANGNPIEVIGGNGQSAIMLDPGSYSVSGDIHWNKRPTSLRLPRRAGLVTLSLDGNNVARPGRNGTMLLLGKRESELGSKERDSLSLDVYRLLTDGHPLSLTTTLMLSVSGQPRLETLGKALLDGFEVTSFSSKLPARLTDNGNLEVQVEPGVHQIEITARALSTPTILASTAQTPGWPAQEVWGFVPKRDLRLVKLTGAPPIDLTQVEHPFAEAQARGYLMENGSTINFNVEQRGNPNPPPNRFNIQREMWLTFDGKGYLVRDNLNADINHASRLSATYPLGRVSVNGEDELINSLNGSEPGIELQSGNYSINAVSEMERGNLTSATGWAVNSDSLSASMHLPPGWRLLWASGVDRTPDAWLASWSLWKIFVLVLLGVLAWRFLGRGFAALLVVATALMMHTAPSVAVVWLVAIVLLAAVRNISHAGVSKVLGALCWGWLFITALLAISQAVTHARQAVYPQLEHHSALSGPRYYDESYDMSPEAPSFGAADSTVSTSAEMSQAKERAMEGLQEIVVIEKRKTRRDKSWQQKKYKEGLQVQTGPGQPRWSWNIARLYWDGPVGATQELRLTLLPPAINRLLNALIAALLVVVTALMMLSLAPRASLPALPGWLNRVTPLLLFGLLLMPAEDTHAASAKQAPLIEAPLLQELERRLLAKPTCFPNCAALQAMEIATNNNTLTLTLDVHSNELVALPLPHSTIWSPSSVTIGTTPAPVGSNGNRINELVIDAGTHRVVMTGSIEGLERFDLNVPLLPARVTRNIANGWQLSGLVNGRVARGSLSFERKLASDVKDETLKPAIAAPFVLIERTLMFDQEWQMETLVKRMAPKSGSFSISVPLRLKEAVLNDEIEVEAGAAQLVFGRNDRQFGWTSRLTPDTAITLTASEDNDRLETWTLIPSNFWHLEYAGLNPLGNSDEFGGPTFAPLAGESLTLDLTQTTPVPGATLTIENAEHRIIVGARQQQHTLSLSALASQGGTLPVRFTTPDNELVSVTIDGQEEPISLIDSTLKLPLTPGERAMSIEWLENTPRSTLLTVEPVEFDVPLANVSTQIQMSQDRWVLLLGGPALGPGILYWGMLLVVILLAVLIVRIPGLPFTATDAILLSLGLSLANLPATLLIAIWVIALRFRGNLRTSISAVWAQNLLQLITAFLSIATILTLIVSVPSALLGTPDMQIEGNGSSAYYYQWFSDRTNNASPAAWVVSLPIWIYRIMMLVWSLWLAFALIRWVPWAWQQWATPKLWYSETPRFMTPDTPDTPDAATPQTPRPEHD